MRQYLVQFLVVFLGVAGALVAYDYWRAMRVKGATSEVLATAESEAGALAAKTEAALAGSRERQDAWLADHRIRALLASELSRTSMLKVMLTECFYSNGVWPEDPADCGIEPAQYRGELLERVTVEPGGVYVAHIRAGQGIGAGTVRFAPDVSGAAPTWTCSTPSYREIRQIIPGCRYAPLTVSPAPAGS